MTIFNRASKLFQPIINQQKHETTKESVLSKSQKLLRALGIVRQTTNGTTILLPMGVRSMKKLKSIVHHEMAKIGAQEISLPYLTSSELWKKSGRIGISELFKVQDRTNHELILSPTHEEAIANFMSNEGSQSYKMFPLKLYQISHKFRDEMKPRFGLIRSREFLMKDLYCFDTCQDTSQTTYTEVTEGYHQVFGRLGVQYLQLKADSGVMGGTLSHEFHFPSDVGEDKILQCRNCLNVQKLEENQDSTKSCIMCGGSDATVVASIEVGHTFMLGTRYSEPLNATFISSSGSLAPLYMSSYGLGLSRIMAASVEVLSTTEYIRWPLAIAPFKICIIPPKKGSKEEAASSLYESLYVTLDNICKDDVMVDDRTNYTIGRRVLEAKRTGWPYLVVIGKRAMEDIPLFELIDTYNNTSQYLTIDVLVDTLKHKLQDRLDSQEPVNVRQNS